MATFGRIENGVVMEVITAIDRKEINSKFHKTIAKQFIEDKSGLIKEGWTHDGASFAAPAPFVPTIAQIKTEAYHRIEKVMPGWMVDREVSGGTAITQTVKNYAAKIRTESAILEASLPSNYTDDSHWTPAPA